MTPAFLLALDGLSCLNYGGACERRHPVLQQDLALQLSAGLSLAVTLVICKCSDRHARGHPGPRRAPPRRFRCGHIVSVYGSVDPELSILTLRREVQPCDSFRREGIAELRLHLFQIKFALHQWPSSADG